MAVFYVLRIKNYLPINSAVTGKNEDFGLHIIVLKQEPYTVIGSGKMRAQNDMLKQEIMLQCNEKLYLTGVISREMYEQAKIKILAQK